MCVCGDVSLQTKAIPKQTTENHRARCPPPYPILATRQTARPRPPPANPTHTHPAPRCQCPSIHIPSRIPHHPYLDPQAESLYAGAYHTKSKCVYIGTDSLPHSHTLGQLVSSDPYRYILEINLRLAHAGSWWHTRNNREERSLQPLP